MEIDMLNGEHIGFTSHLFTSTELDRLFRPHLKNAEFLGLDVFHSRFATDRRWNPTHFEREAEFTSDLELLERRSPTTRISSTGPRIFCLSGKAKEAERFFL